MNEHLRQTPETEVCQQRIPIFISGMGKMGTLIAEQVAQSDHFVLSRYAMTSARHRRTVQKFGEQNVLLVDYCPSHRELAPGTIAVDFTTAKSAVLNVIQYTYLNIPFVMGTTGGDRQEIEKMVRRSQISAVIAPNMATEVVEVQDEFQRLIETSPDTFQGWHMTVRESHQVAKRDVSGTARAFQAQLERLGATMEGEIESIRDPEVQRQLGIKNLDGHAYHWITLTGPNDETREFTTAIEGRQSYVEGTLAAIRFLAIQIRNGSQGEVFTMSDVVSGLRRIA